MAKRSVLKTALTDEAWRTILREAEGRYRQELLPDEERQQLRDCILRIRRQLRLLSS